jgi:tRNA(Ile)-lysidine synthase
VSEPERGHRRRGPDPAVASVRLAVRRTLRDLEPGRPVLAACSGGADSLALAGALAFEAPRSGRRAGGITVDHGLQAGSADRAHAVTVVLRDLGLDPVESAAATVGTRGGPEAAARDARYAILDEAAERLGATVLLGHTLNDQAETVLLGLARGSGARSLSGMPQDFGRGAAHYVRPVLGLDRATTRRACLAMGLDPWDDPHNDDSTFTRVRVRRDALPVLEKTLGPGIAEALARTAGLLRDDADALDAWADGVLAGLGVGSGEPGTAPAVEVSALAELPRAVRTRVLRRVAIAAGSPAGTLAAVHVDAVDRLVTGWRGQHHVDLPGGVEVFRRYGRLLFGRTESA